MQKTLDPIPNGIIPGDPTKPLDAAMALQFQNMLSKSKILALGESFHTSEGYYQAKINIFKHFILNGTLKAIAFENPWDGTRFINQYVLGDDIELAELPSKLFKTWQCKSILGFIKWLRGFNSDLPQAERVSFFGFDVQKPGESLLRVREFIKNYDASELKSLNSSTGSLILREAEKDNFYDLLSIQKLFDSHGEVLLREDLFKLLEDLNKAEDLRAQHEPQNLDLQISLICMSYYSRYIFETAGGKLNPESDKSYPAELAWKLPYETRDKGMFEVFNLIYNSLGKPHVGLWAHNLHLLTQGEKIPAWKLKAFGSYLDEKFGRDYCPVALIAYDYQIHFHWHPGMKDFVKPPHKIGSIETILKEMNVGPCYIDFEKQSFLRKTAGIEDLHPIENIKDHFRGAIYLDYSPKMELLEVAE